MKNEEKEKIELAKCYLEDINRDIASQIERTSMRLQHLEEIQRALIEERRKLKESNIAKEQSA